MTSVNQALPKDGLSFIPAHTCIVIDPTLVDAQQQPTDSDDYSSSYDSHHRGSARISKRPLGDAFQQVLSNQTVRSSSAESPVYKMSACKTQGVLESEEISDLQASVEINEGEKKPGKKRKPLVAKKVEWKDIPDWDGRTDCPLLEVIPREVLDMCFGLSVNVGLTLRDYVSLAGVCTFFRSQMTDMVFQELHNSSDPNLPVLSNGPSTTKYAHRIFTHTVPADWRRPKPVPVCYPEPTHYAPRGTRESWSEAQYIVYKEEQYMWKLEYRVAQRKALIRSLQSLRQARLQMNKAQKPGIRVGTYHRNVLGRVRGRQDGESPVEKDNEGNPKEEYNLEVQAERERAIPVAEEELPSHVPTHVTDGIMTRVKGVKDRRGEWKTPESDSGDDIEHEDNIVIDSFRDVSTGEIIHQPSWPSVTRGEAVQVVHSSYIIKSEAMREFKVTEAELLCLKHLLIPNPMSKKNPQQVFWRSAVEALAYRSHGGPFGHSQFIKRSNEMLAKNHSTRKRKKEKAKEGGWHVEKRRRHIFLPGQWKALQKRRGNSSADPDEEDDEMYCKEGCTCQGQLF
ncbi:uncharacterized protein IL334_000327 [Kwoniella shivajii]|uniref:F-box domain-containing protein n=1 Tax=Kwoniella shivajii TaxID=564305 RepID=A0ABZ1CPY3_9TREE|nr:hypothetical protein IL334_000327 [Kwoniella shivajii]